MIDGGDQRMNAAVGLIVVIVLVALVLGVIWYSARRRRRDSEELKQIFGAEYERTVDAHGETGEAEKELAARRERVQQLHIKTLSGEQSTRYARQWRDVQALFVDDPEQAI